ncbi:MAG TPA: glycoside hydrolase family 125 protein [Longimicrobiales bacterium]
MPADADLTGNDYVSIPSIRADGAIDGINVLHGASAGLIEWAGAPETGALLRPVIRFAGETVTIADAQWRRLDRWIPTFTAKLADGSTVTGTICAPGGYPPARGFLIRIEAENRGRAPRTLQVDLDIEWVWSRLWIATGRPLPGPNCIAADPAGVLMLEVDGGRGPALAIAGRQATDLAAGTTADALLPLAPGSRIAAPNGSRLFARLRQSVEVKPNSRAGIVYHVGAGRERDGAAAAASALQRHTADHWLRQARLDISHILRPAQDHRWAEPLNRNLVFNRYYAVARAIDDDRLYLLRSRSTACPAPALLNEREALLWTLPALIIADPGIAREAMFRMFEIASERSGEFLRYTDGGTYDAAFVLDQFLLYAWAIQHYVTATGDAGVLDDPLTRQVILETDAAAYMRLHPQHLLAATELLPSGDVADHPYATMANALLWKFCEVLPRLMPPVPGEEPLRFQDAAAEVAAALWQHCVSEIAGALVFASSTSVEGETAVYDDPALSLALLPFFGFCAADDPVWGATMDFMRSSRYPLWRDGAVPGLAGRNGSDRAHTAALCADLLGDRSADALKRLQRLSFPGGVAAAQYDVTSGACSQPHHAALAGFLAWTLVQAAEPKDELASRRKQRR